MMRNRIIAGILSIQTLLYVFSGITVFARDNIVNINSKEDFVSFAEACTLDSYSRGKTVRLNCDIDFSGDEFFFVPIFGGSFEGNGYTLSGIKCRTKGSYNGVFRKLERGGKITELNVKGEFSPGGMKSYVGGIVGENSGTIEACTFEGSVKGENVIGGIVGINSEYGQIISCISSGEVIGENSSGGIVGKSDGFIQGCTNNASVNTIYEEKKNDISNIDVDTGAIVENRKNSEEENDEESILGHTDTGGIVGYSSGIVSGCINNGAVGYKHVGYNVGGIAGRQSGYMINCGNYGFIQGRKDVGGIVGQAEPYILLNASEGSLKDLKKELDSLNSLINKFITDADILGDDTSGYLEKVADYAQSAQGYAEDLVNYGGDFADDNLDEINAQTAILSAYTDRLTPPTEKLENGFEDLADALDILSASLDDIKIYLPDMEEELDDLSDALEKFFDAEEYLQNAISKLNKAKRDLSSAIEFKNVEKVKTALSQISSSIKEMISAKNKIKNSLDEIENILNSKPEDFEAVGANVKKLAENIKIIKENNELSIKALQSIIISIDTIILNTEIDFSEFKSASVKINMATGYLFAAMHETNEPLVGLSGTVGDIYDILSSYTDDINEDFSNARNEISDGFRLLSYAAEDIGDAVGDIGDIMSDLSNEKPLELVKLGDDFKDASEKLFDSLSGISGELDGLRTDFSLQTDKIGNDLTAISNSFNSVMNLIINELEALNNGGLTDKLVDVSDENIESTRQGKIEACHNFGAVEADRNTGGIAGAVAIEYLKELEDDIEKPNTLNFTYRSKAVIYSCINDGKIVGKKDCTGGIAGIEEIGTVYKCENYADIEADNGNYVGGIVGKSEAVIRKSYSKSKVSGKRFIGGIVGKADSLTASYAISNVSGEENIGSVCGEAANSENVYRNFYVDNRLGAIDGISYAEKAEPISFEALSAINGIPSRFISFCANFIVDDKVIKTQEIEYGEDTARIKYPDIPSKDGYFGEWIKPEADKVSENLDIVCEYKPYITILSSEERSSDGKLALALCEGEFTDKARLHINKSNETPPEGAGERTAVYDISILNSDIEDDECVTVRILNSEKDKVTAKILTDGKWEKVKTSARGKYTVLAITGSKSTVCLKYEKKGILPVLTAVTVGMLAIAATVFVKRKRIKEILIKGRKK